MKFFVATLALGAALVSADASVDNVTRCTGELCPWHATATTTRPPRPKPSRLPGDAEKRCIGEDCPWRTTGKDYYDIGRAEKRQVQAAPEPEADIEKRCRPDMCPWRNVQQYYKSKEDVAATQPAAAEPAEATVEKRCNHKAGEDCLARRPFLLLQGRGCCC